MKAFLKSFVSLAPLLVMALFPTRFARAQGVEGHGGNAYTIEFYEAGRYALDHLKNWGPDRIPQINRDALEKAMIKTTLNSSPHVYILENGKKTEKQAKNIHGNEIIIGEKSWDQLERDIYKKSALALHEYLGILGIELDSNSIYSSEYLKWLSQTSSEEGKIDSKEQEEKIFDAYAQSFYEGKLPKSNDLTKMGQVWSCQKTTRFGASIYRSQEENRYSFDLIASRVFISGEYGSVETKTDYRTEFTTESNILGEKYFRHYAIGKDQDLYVETKVRNQSISFERCSQFKKILKERLLTYAVYARPLFTIDVNGLLSAYQENGYSIKTEDKFQKAFANRKKNPGQFFKQAQKYFSTLKETEKYEQDSEIASFNQYQHTFNNWIEWVAYSDSARAKLIEEKETAVRNLVQISIDTLGHISNEVYHTEYNECVKHSSKGKCKFDAQLKSIEALRAPQIQVSQEFELELRKILLEVDSLRIN